MTAMQARADEIYTKAGRRAPPPLPYELPKQFRRRLAAGLQEYSPRLQLQRHGGRPALVLLNLKDDPLTLL
jgi:hypothetical protein